MIKKQFFGGYESIEEGSEFKASIAWDLPCCPIHLLITINSCCMCLNCHPKDYLALCYLDTLSPWEQMHMGSLVVLKLSIHDLNDD